MPTLNRYPVPNPRLGTFYAIFTSALIGLVMLFIILERLGLGRFWLSYIVSCLPLIFAASLGIATLTNNKHDFLVAGWRVPASFNGFILAISSLGGAGILSLTGLFFLIGFDAASLLLGWCLGLFFLAVIFAPFVRRLDVQSLPELFQERFGSRLAASTVTFLIILPIFMILVAELKLGAFAAVLITGLGKDIILAALAALVLLAALPGGIRSMTWVGCAHFIMLLIGFLVPLVIVSVFITNLPLPQITYGTLLDDLTGLETINGLTKTAAAPMSAALAGNTPEPIEKLFLQSFGALSKTNFVLLLLCVLFGTATFPTLIMRANTVRSVHDARRSAGWGLALIAVILVSTPAYAVFTKYMMFQNLIGATIDQLPEWANDLINLRLLEIHDQDQNASLGLKELYVRRDGLPFILPIMAGLPFALIVMTVTAALSASISSATAQITTITTSLIGNLSAKAKATVTDNATRLLMRARVGMVLITGVGAWTAYNTNVDPLWLILWALSISASTLLAPLTYAFFWSRFSAGGAIAAMVAGFGASTAYIALTPTGSEGLVGGISHLISGVIGMPVSFLVGAMATYATAGQSAGSTRRASAASKNKQIPKSLPTPAQPM